MVQDLNERQFRDVIFDYKAGDNAPLLVKNNTIVEFWVTWCPHCQAMAPRYSRMSEKHPDVDCYRVEMEEHPAVAEVFEVESFPTFVFINKNGEMKKWVGELAYEEIGRAHV